MKLGKLIGDKKFYKMVLAVSVPIMVQNGITNFVGLLDNIMVGRVGTDQMSGVAIINQLIFVFNLCIFGAISGAGIFTAQFYGHGNNKGVRDTFRFKIIICGVLCLVAFLVFNFCSEPLVMQFVHSSSGSGDAQKTLAYALDYLKVILWGFIPFAFTQIYSGTLRECKQTVVPMNAGIAAVVVNLIFNYLLIYGKFGFPALGVSGAALATVFSRFVELSIVVVWTHRHRRENIFINGAYKNFTVPKYLVKQIALKGSPLMLNEILWSLGMTMLTHLYSLRGLPVISALSISSTLTNLFSVVYIALGSSVGIIIGNLLGAGEFEKAKDYDAKLIAFATSSCFLVGALMAVTSGLFPQIYNTTDEIKTLAASFILINSCVLPLRGFTHAAYFTMRCGGKTVVTFLFDSVFCWVVVVSCAWILIKLTMLPIIAVVAICEGLDVIKCIIGYVLVKKGVWINNILEGSASKKIKTGQTA